MRIEPVRIETVTQTSNVSDMKTQQKKAENRQQEVAAKDGKERETSKELSIEEVPKQKIEEALEQVNKQIKQDTRTMCQFSYHEDTKRISIKVLDENTKEVIKEIPPEKTLDMIAKVMEIAGLFLDEKR